MRVVLEAAATERPTDEPGEQPASDRVQVGCKTGTNGLIPTPNLLPVVALLSTMLCLPFLYYIEWVGDEGILLNGATRMLSGERLYVDFFEFYPPGGFLLLESWFCIVGSSFFSARILAILTIVGISLLTYLCCHEVSRRSSFFSAMVAIGWVIVSQLVWKTQISHHWFTTLFSMFSAWAALRSARSGTASGMMCFASGLAAGAAAMITPTRGALVVLASSIAFIRRTGTLGFTKFVLGCAVAPIVAATYIIYQGASVSAFADVIVFPATQYSSIQVVPFGFGGDWRSPLKLVYFFDFFLTLTVLVSDWSRCLRDPVLRTSVALALAGLLGAYPRPDLAHIAFALPLALPLMAYCVAALSKVHSRFTYLAAALIFFSWFPTARAFYWTAIEIMNMKLTHTERGYVAFAEDGAAELVSQVGLEPAGDNFFFYPYMPMLSYLTGREQASRYELFLPYYTTADQYSESCKAVLGDVSVVVVNAEWTDQRFLRRLFPTMKEAKLAEKEEFDAVLRSGFAPYWQAGAFQMLRRVKDVPDRACPGGRAASPIEPAQLR